MNQLIQQATQRLRSQGRASRNNARRAVSSLAALSLLLMAQGGLTPPRVHAAPAAYLNDQAPEVAPAHQKRMNSLWERSAKGETIGSRCGFFGGLIENPFGARPLSPQAEAEARTAQELC